MLKTVSSQFLILKSDRPLEKSKILRKLRKGSCERKTFHLLTLIFANTFFRLQFYRVNCISHLRPEARSVVLSSAIRPGLNIAFFMHQIKFEN